MCKVIAVINQKGGVAKTTTTAQLGLGLARMGKKVLMVDADPQGSLTTMLGWWDRDNMRFTLREILEKVLTDAPVAAGEGILHHAEGVDLVPANIGLAELEIKLVVITNREHLLQAYIDMQRDYYDYILIDCMPSLGLISVNCMTAADSILIPCATEYMSYKGFEQLIRSIRNVKLKLNPTLRLAGMVMTRFKRTKRTTYFEEVAEQIKAAASSAGIKVFDSVIPESDRMAEASVVGKSIYEYSPRSGAAYAYRRLVDEIRELSEDTLVSKDVIVS